MKKSILAFLLAAVILTVTAGAYGYVVMFSEDGRTITIPEEEKEAYKGVGWYSTYEEVTQTMYASDGRCIVVYKSEVPAYKAVGWYDSYEDVVATMYTMDGRMMKVYKNDIPVYKKLGWYDSYEDVTETLYSSDGRTLVIYKSEVPLYLTLGWHESRKYIDPSKPMVAITYDDGPSSYTSTILEVFARYGGAATFFVVGKNASAYPSLISRENEMGMEIANHTYDHPNLTNMSPDNIMSQIKSTDNSVYNACGKTPSLLRPPYGAYNSNVKSVAGKPLILWSIDTRDWESRNADKVYANIINNVKDGDIILMHDLYKSTAEATTRIIPALINKGFQLVTVSDLAKYKGITLENGGTYSSIR